MQRFLGLIVGVIFLAVGVFMYFRNESLTKNCTEEAEATVVDMRQDFSTDSDSMSYMYYPIIEYRAGENLIRVEIGSGSSTPAYSINDKITILYNPNKQKEFIVKGDKSTNIISIVFAVLGVLITGYGIKMAVKKD